MGKLSPEVANALRKAASAFLEAANEWQDSDQAAWEATGTQIHRGIGMSLDELAFELFAFADEEVGS